MTERIFACASLLIVHDDLHDRIAWPNTLCLIGNDVANNEAFFLSQLVDTNCMNNFQALVLHCANSFCEIYLNDAMRECCGGFEGSEFPLVLREATIEVISLETSHLATRTANDAR